MFNSFPIVLRKVLRPPLRKTKLSDGRETKMTNFTRGQLHLMEPLIHFDLVHRLVTLCFILLQRHALVSILVGVAGVVTLFIVILVIVLVALGVIEHGHGIGYFVYVWPPELDSCIWDSARVPDSSLRE